MLPGRDNSLLRQAKEFRATVDLHRGAAGAGRTRHIGPPGRIQHGIGVTPKYHWQPNGSVPVACTWKLTLRSSSTVIFRWLRRDGRGDEPGEG
jgi:hypothetical protein